MTKDSDGKEHTTDWVSATDVELSMIRNNLFPPRAGIQAAQLASEVKGAFDDLTDDHRVIAGLNYFDGDWEQRMETKMASYGGADAVTAFIAKDHMAVAYATQVARAVWGRSVTRVQYRITRQNVVPFAQRNDPDAQPPALKVTVTGWRGLAVNPGQSDAAFADVFRAQWEATR